jgi:predicted nucleic acid-binding Zn ribbon protein
MPTYVYKFVDTGETIEIQQAFTDATLTEIAHPDSGKVLAVKKVFTPVGVTFKGSGFFKTDNRGKKSATETGSKKDGDSTSGDSKSSDSSSSSESKSTDSTSSESRGSDSKPSSDSSKKADGGTFSKSTGTSGGATSTKSATPTSS